MNYQFWCKGLAIGATFACSGVSWGQTELASAKAPTLAKLRRVRQVKLPSLKQSVERIEFSRDGKVAALQAYGDLVIFDAKTWRPLHTFKANLAPSLNQFALSPDGKIVALVHYKQSLNWAARTGITLEVRNARTGQLRFSLFQSDLDNHVIFSPDGKRLFTLSDTADWRHENVAKTLGCWNVATGRLIWHQHSSQPAKDTEFDPFDDSFSTEYGDIVHSSGLAVTSDGKTLATEEDGLVELRAADSGVKRLSIRDAKRVQAPLIFSGDGKLLATSADIASYYFGPDEYGPYFATALYGVKIWDTQTGKLRAIMQATKEQQNTGYIYMPLAFWPQQEDLLVLSYMQPEGPMTFDARTGTELESVEIESNFTSLGAAISPDGKFLIMATDKNDKIGLDYYARQ